MQAGKLRHYVTLQNKQATTTGSRGQVTNTWEDTQGNIPAEIVTLNGREAEIARQMVASADTRVRLRYVANVTPASRFVWESRVFNILWVNNTDQRNRELVCLCQEVPSLAGGTNG